jgi:crotonobetainyl-CoA:carnitine CoA-transferase CaiB-like acyl-CoA transferase
VPHAVVWDYADVFRQSQVLERGMKVTVRDPEGKQVDLIGSPFHIGGSKLPPPTMPPRLGEETAAVLGELLGLDAARLEDLRSRGIV